MVMILRVYTSIMTIANENMSASFADGCISTQDLRRGELYGGSLSK